MEWMLRWGLGRDGLLRGLRGLSVFGLGQGEVCCRISVFRDIETYTSRTSVTSYDAITITTTPSPKTAPQTNLHQPKPPLHAPTPTPRQPHGPPPQILPHHLPLNNQRADILQNKRHARPLSTASITPRVHSGALHGDVAAAHERLAAVVEQHEHAAFGYDAVVEGGRAVG